MSFRTVVINSRVKLEYSLNYLVCRGEKELKISLNEISLLIIQNIACSITVALMSELVSRKIGVIICDEKHNPQFELMPYYNSSEQYLKIKKQIAWNETIKDELWKKIVHAKIKNQALVLFHHDLEEHLKLEEYMKDVLDGDSSNREGHAAKVYFNALFGKDFSRRDDTIDINKYLNYGYSIILSAVNREITSFGYLTQLGIHHIGETNPFNLSCDFMEPLRPFVDGILLNNNVNDDNFKSVFISILSSKCFYDGKSMYLDNAIHLYVQQLFSYLNSSGEKEVEFIIYGT